MSMVRNRLAMGGALAVLLVALSPPVLADIFINVPGVPGGTTETTHRNWIDCAALAWGIVDSGGAPAYQTVEITADSGFWATGLANLASRRQAVDPVVIEVTRNFGGVQKLVTRITLRNAVVRSLRLTQGEALTVGTLQFAIGFDQIEWTETAYNGSGTAIGNTLFRGPTTK